MDDIAQSLYQEIIKAFDSNGMHCDRDDSTLTLYFHFIGEFSMDFTLSVKSDVLTITCPIATSEDLVFGQALFAALVNSNSDLDIGEFCECGGDVFYESTSSLADLDGDAVLDLIYTAVDEIESHVHYFRR